ncbi:DUF4260 domain-containing protein [Hanstruepera neustonica]|uniref:DUF4260 domain-containing protein n=1 Tax=Hanstruepera neustonica TaxID=1445657 RepID=A0A2K1E4D5_9FLAO|nr:DUF4260 domain-containing protein [Hanstruepera neustonica]PNQ75123.1 DUF4260 domain-containing protein [Hanstruepera neustonica]
MKNLLKLEEFAMFGLGILAFNQLHYPWWWFLVLLLTPDIGMLGYLINSKVGAFTYNLCHHKGLAIIIYIIGVAYNNDLIQLIGIMVFSHASLDRIFGYGLKYNSSFQNTHLGKVGKHN